MSEEDAVVAVLEVEPPEGERRGKADLREVVICRPSPTNPCMPEPGMCLKTSPGGKDPGVGKLREGGGELLVILGPRQ